LSEGRRYRRPEEGHAVVGGLCDRDSDVYRDQKQQEAQGYFDWILELLSSFIFIFMMKVKLSDS
jgi:hypothetical protein